MACTDDDEHRVHEPTARLNSFRFDLNLSYEMAAVDSPEKRLHSRLMNGKWAIHHHYIPFPRSQWYPIGCTRTHAFAVIKSESGGYTPICMQLVYRTMVRPSQCLVPPRDFVSPWRRYPEPFADFLGGCAHEDRMCLVLRGGLLVIDANWMVHLRDNCITLATLVSCSMNGRYLVVVGVETGMETQSLFVYDLRTRPACRVHYTSVVEPAIRAVSLLANIEGAMLVQCENGRTRRVLLAEQSRGSRYQLKDVGDLTTTAPSERPLFAKELSETSRIVQLLGNAFILVKSKDDVDRASMAKHQLFVDVIDYEQGVVAGQDANNSLHFFTSKLTHIISVPWETIAAASLLYENGVPSILRPYPSLGRCVDAPDVVTLLASFGALVTIKIL